MSPTAKKHTKALQLRRPRATWVSLSGSLREMDLVAPLNPQICQSKTESNYLIAEPLVGRNSTEFYITFLLGYG